MLHPNTLIMGPHSTLSFLFPHAPHPCEFGPWVLACRLSLPPGALESGGCLLPPVIPLSSRTASCLLFSSLPAQTPVTVLFLSSAWCLTAHVASLTVLRILTKDLTRFIEVSQWLQLRTDGLQKFWKHLTKCKIGLRRH